MNRRRPFGRARRRISVTGGLSGERLARRLDRTAHRLNPYLLAVVIGLAVLDLTFFAAKRVMPRGVTGWHVGSTTLSR